MLPPAVMIGGLIRHFKARLRAEISAARPMMLERAHSFIFAQQCFAHFSHAPPPDDDIDGLL